jgi:uncharacterized protein YkwD
MIIQTYQICTGHSLKMKEDGYFEHEPPHTEDTPLPPAKQPTLTYNAVHIDTWKEKQGN